MRQIVSSCKDSPLLGHLSCIASSSEVVVSDQSIPKTMGLRQQIEKDRRLRREIANSNERRRMQSINHGYQLLKDMLPTQEGAEKLSKAAVLQHAAEYMGQLLEDRKRLLMQNAELNKVITSQREPSDSISNQSIKRKKRDTESSDEGISMSYQSPHHESDIIEDLRRDVAELRVQLERERQKYSALEQSYAYMMMLSQTEQHQILSTNPSLSSALQSTSTDGHHSVCFDGSKKTCTRPTYVQDLQCSKVASSEYETLCGKASTVASQNLSIIVEAINHLEGDRQQISDKDADSGVSHSELSDDAKSEYSRTETPQPPPAHQPSMMAALGHTSLYNSSTLSLMYRSSFLNTPVPPVQTSGVILSPQF